MSSLHLLFSHKLTDDQLRDAQENLSVTEFIPLPETLQKLWSQIPPENELDEDIIEQFTQYLSSEVAEGDYVLIQGEFGMTFYFADWCLKNNRIPIYATSKRISSEYIANDGSVKKLNVFKHIQFRKYKEAK